MYSDTHIVPFACWASNTSPLEKWRRSIGCTWRSLGEEVAGRRRASHVAGVLRDAARGASDPRRPGLLRHIFSQLRYHGVDLIEAMSEWYEQQQTRRRFRKSR